MGAHPWRYLVPYDPDLGKALAELREREFIAGRYNPAEPFPGFSVDRRRAPGAKHPTIDAARQAAGASGTRSILDMLEVSPKPRPGVVTPLDEDDLTDVFSTLEPTRNHLEDNEALFEMIERGHGVSFVVYENGLPSELCFAGYSYD
jgi:hypothetical protein